jgi:hypothetical protein
MAGPTSIRNSRISEHAVDERDARFGNEAMSPVRDVEKGSVGETIAGAGAIVLAILGLIGLVPGALDSIAVIAAGFGILVGSTALATRYRQVLGRAAARHLEIGGGLGTTALGGLAGITLGILALLGVSQLELVSIAPIVMGGALLIASAATARFEQTAASKHGEDFVYVASGADSLVGAGAIVLGILALSGSAPLTLSLVALIAIGCATFMSGTSVASQMFAMSR